MASLRRLRLTDVRTPLSVGIRAYPKFERSMQVPADISIIILRIFFAIAKEVTIARRQMYKN
jgi:hypothetical protein